MGAPGALVLPDRCELGEGPGKNSPMRWNLWLVRSREAGCHLSLKPFPLTLSAALEQESTSSQLRPTSIQHFPFHFVLNPVHIAFCSFSGSRQQPSCITTDLRRRVPVSSPTSTSAQGCPTSLTKLSARQPTSGCLLSAQAQRPSLPISPWYLIRYRTGRTSSAPS